MKLFDYWTELPQGICSLFSEISEELIRISNTIFISSGKIMNSQAQIIKIIKSIDSSMISKADQELLSAKLETIEKEKQSLSVQSIKTTVKILNEIIKIIESQQKPSKDLLSKLSILMKFTKSIIEKINFEKSFYQEKNENLGLSLVEKEQECQENQEKIEFCELILCFAEKINSRLFLKSNELLSIINLTNIDKLKTIKNNEFADQLEQEDLNNYENEFGKKAFRSVEKKVVEKKCKRDLKELRISQKTSVDSLSTTDDNSSYDSLSPDHKPKSQELYKNEETLVYLEK